MALIIGGSPAAHAETGKKALILGSSVTGGTSSTEATSAVAKGFTVTVVDDATWGAMTASQFADYQLVVVGDPTCNLLSAVVSQNAGALADAVMARAGGNTKAGNRVLIGTDPQFHKSQGGDQLIDRAIDFAGVQEGATNLYLDFSCLDNDWDGDAIGDGQDKLLPLLTIDSTPGWTQNTAPPCGGDVSLISNAAQFSTLSSTTIRGWNCSVHETFPTFPTDWAPLAIATDVPTAPTCGSDVDTGAARCGEAYVLIAGSGIVVEAPNLSLDPPTATNPVGTTHTVTATVTNADGTPRAGVVVDFVVTGANAGAVGTCVPSGCATNASGKVTFTYTGAVAGDDTINAAITVDGSRQTATAAKTWIAAAAEVSINDATVTEGNTGTSPATPATFTVSLAAPATTPLTVNYQTADASATQPADYIKATGAVTFAVGQVSKPVTVSVVGDLADEPNETFHVTLATSTAGVTIVDGDGLGKIIDDDRSGTFTCRGAGLRLLGSELAVSNAAETPCKDAATAPINVPLGSGTLRVGANVLTSSTDQTPNKLVGTTPALNDRGEATAQATGVTLLAGTSTVTASVVTSKASATCIAPLGGRPALASSSNLTTVKVNGSPVVVGSGEVRINLLLGVLHINSKTTTATAITQRGIWFENTLLPRSADIVVAEAKAGYSGNPCR